jgi:SAM-dependent methyltransferase
MKREGDVEAARRDFLTHRLSNLNFLLQKRFSWMNPYIVGKERVIELGAGAGFSKFYLANTNLLVTDIVNHDWVDQQVDALNLPFSDESVDVFICSLMFHHIAKPIEFLENLSNALKPGGYILLNEVHPSFMHKFMMKLMRHEGWSYEVDVWNRSQVINNPEDPWSANCAVAALIFDQPERFHQEVSNLRIIHDKYVEFFIFLLSGGVTAKTFTIPLPYWALKTLDLLDRLLCRSAPGIFALTREIVLKKESEHYDNHQI